MRIWVHTFNPVALGGIKILMELCQKYPTVPVIFGHMGGSNWMDCYGGNAMAKAVAITEQCPMEIGLNILGGKWKLKILWQISKGARGYPRLGNAD